MFPSAYFATDYFVAGYWPRGAAPPVPDVVEAVAAFLRSDAALSALVGARIRAAWLAEGDPLPAVAVTFVSTDPLADLGGNLGTDTTRLQIDVWANSMADAVTASRRVRVVLDGFSGTMAGLRVGSARRIGESRPITWPDDAKGRP